MRSRSMQSLTDAIKRRFPGVVVYGKGDAAHALRTSDHNEDDTSGSRPAQTDADSNPEHRAIDVMLGPALTRALDQLPVHPPDHPRPQATQHPAIISGSVSRSAPVERMV